MSDNYYITNYRQRPPWWGILAVLLICVSTGYSCYVEGYRRGCQDAMTVVEDRADKLITRLGFN